MNGEDHRLESAAVAELRPVERVESLDFNLNGGGGT